MHWIYESPRPSVHHVTISSDTRTDDQTATGWSGHPRGSREYRRMLFALACAGVATFAQLYAPQGILPLLATDLAISPAAAALTVSAGTLGLAAGVLPWSRVADRIGRVRAMKISLVAATALGLLVPLAPSYPMLIGLRVLEGVALGGLPALAVTYLNEEVDRRHAALAAGTYVAGTTIGGLLGRVVAGPLADWLGWRVGVAVVAVAAAAMTLTFMAVVPAAKGFRPRAGSARPGTGRAVLANLRDRRMVVLYAQGFLLMGGFVAMYNFLAFRLTAAPFHLPGWISSLLFVAYLAGTVSSQVAGRLADRLGRRTVLRTSVLVMMAGVAAMLSDFLPLVLLGLVVMTTGFFGAHSIAAGWTARRATVGAAQAASLYNLFYYAGSSLFGWLGGVFFLHLGWPGTVWMALALAGVALGWSLTDRGAARAEAPTPTKP